MVNSIKKGKDFERKIAHLLTEITEKTWRRVPMSGAFATSYNTESPQFKGDVFTEDASYSDIVIECKAHKELSLTDLFNHKSKLYSWIEQSERESLSKNKTVSNPWILFFKINNIGTFVLFCNKYTPRIEYYNIYTKLWHGRRKYLYAIKLKNLYTVFMISNPK